MDDFTATLSTSALARLAGVPEQRIRLLADRGVIPHVRDSNGRRLFLASAAKAVREQPLRSPRRA
jgi:DNA-binding transcriptional MerR regulator